MERASWGPSKYLPDQQSQKEVDTPMPVSLLSLLRRVDPSGTPTIPTMLFELEDHPGFALLSWAFLRIPAGRYGFPCFGRGNTPLPSPTLFSGERWVHNSYIRDPMISSHLGFETVVHAVGIHIGFWTPVHEGLIPTQNSRGVLGLPFWTGGVGVNCLVHWVPRPLLLDMKIVSGVRTFYCGR